MDCGIVDPFPARDVDPIETHPSGTLADAQNGDSSQSLDDAERTPPQDLQRLVACVERQRTALRRDSRIVGLLLGFAVIDDRGAACATLKVEGDEKSVRRRGARAGRVAWL